MPRIAVENFTGSPGSIIWISIEDPNCNKSRVNNPHLEGIPTLRIAMWDLTEPVPIIGGDMAFPPTASDATKIVDFLTKNPNKNILVNCTAGVARSGAVAAFCEECLGYSWEGNFKETAKPNHVLLQELKTCWEEIHKEKENCNLPKSPPNPTMAKKTINLREHIAKILKEAENNGTIPSLKKKRFEIENEIPSIANICCAHQDAGGKNMLKFLAEVAKTQRDPITKEVMEAMVTNSAFEKLVIAQLKEVDPPEI